MNIIKTLIFLLLIATTNSCSSQDKNVKSEFKNTIELSIDSTSSKLNPLIKKINILLKEQESDKELMNMYFDSKSSLRINKEMINQLTEVDNKINLKERTLVYLENCDKILEAFVLPVIKYLNESEEIDRNKLIEAFPLIQKTLNETNLLSDSLDEFCAKYKLERQMNDFEKDALQKKFDDVKAKLEIKN